MAECCTTVPDSPFAMGSSGVGSPLSSSILTESEGPAMIPSKQILGESPLQTLSDNKDGRIRISMKSLAEENRSLRKLVVELSNIVVKNVVGPK